MSNKRYKIDKRIGCVAIVDTQHPSYGTYEGVHGEALVEFKIGLNNSKVKKPRAWYVPLSTMKEMVLKCKKLNNEY